MSGKIYLVGANPVDFGRPVLTDRAARFVTEVADAVAHRHGFSPVQAGGESFAAGKVVQADIGRQFGPSLRLKKLDQATIGKNSVSQLRSPPTSGRLGSSALKLTRAC